MARSFVVTVATLLVAAGGCLSADTVDCPGGGVCPQGLVCRLDQGAQICALPTCGNGITESGESCDDGNNDSSDLCPGDCVALPTCGNGDREFGEECDDGNLVSGDGCQSTCLLPVRPPLRAEAAMAYDSARNVLVVFGGRHDDARLRDTWEWNGTEWIERQPALPLPPARFGAAMTYDSVRRRVVMFGGFSDVMVPLGDTWEWDGVTWTERGPGTHPPSGFSLMTFDRDRGVAVLLTDGPTWELDGSGWTSRSGGLVPMVPSFAVAAYHDTERVTVLVDGMSPTPLRWNGSVWSMWQTNQPPQMMGGGMVYDRARGRLVMVGSRVESTPTWELDGMTWTERTDVPGPPPRAGASVVYVDSLGATIRFGGQDSANGPVEWHNDMWSWDGSTWRELR